MTIDSMDRPTVLYKYLNRKGADVFLEKPQLRHCEFYKLDDICDSLPAFSTLSEEQALQNAIERVSRNPVTGIALEKQVTFYKELGRLSPEYLEQEMRELNSKGEGYTAYVCSLVARPDSIAMWCQYAEDHRGIVFGIRSNLHRVISDKGRFIEQVEYPPTNERLHTPFNNPKLDEEIARVFWTKGLEWDYQEEWRIISGNAETDFLESGEVAEIVFGWRFDGDKERVMGSEVFEATRFFEATPCPTHYRMSIREIQRRNSYSR